jgi:hypothetical protein
VGNSYWPFGRTADRKALPAKPSIGHR